MTIKYAHTNIISSNWKNLAQFYSRAFECEILKPERRLDQEWLAQGSAIEGATLEGVHLRLPGFGEDGPTLEIFQYQDNIKPNTRVANREGFGHLAFQTDDVEGLIQRIIDNGGSRIGQIVDVEIEGAGKIRWVYCADPEGNLIEVQQWY